MEGSIEINWEGVKTIITLPYITGIDDSYSASLTEIGTLIYGAENRFVMDLGTQRRITLNCTRVNPADYNDSLNRWENSDSWSNGKWITEFIKALDHWQNLMDPKGGFSLKLISPDKELFPNIIKNVFLAGSITPKYSVQKMTFSLPLVVASMTGDKKEIKTVTIRFESDVSGEYFTQAYPIGSTVPVPSVPASWQGLKTGYSFSHWVSGSVVYYPGELTEWSVAKTLEARWQGPIEGGGVFTTPGEYSLPVPTSANRAMIYAVGGGGGSGITYMDLDTEGNINEGIAGIISYPGGAGAGAEMIVSNVYLRNTPSISITVGKGGSSASGKVYDGSDGEDTIVIAGRKELTAKGGQGGKGARPNYKDKVLGGQSAWAGGFGGTLPTDGTTDINSPTPGLPGTASEYESWTAGDSTSISYGGAGGGAPPLNHKFEENGSTYRSIGGSGGSRDYAATSGYYGGGAGSGLGASDTKGGDGLVAVIFYV